MLKKILHHIVAIPFIYDLLQMAVGAKIIRKRLKQRLTHIAQNALVVDIGGGTGLNRSLFGDIEYICLDNDPVKLKGFSQKRVNGQAILGDATLRMNFSEEGEGVLFGVAPQYQGLGIYRFFMINGMKWVVSGVKSHGRFDTGQ